MTNGWDRTSCHMSRSELSVAVQSRDTRCRSRIFNFPREPGAFEFRPLPDARVVDADVFSGVFLLIELHRLSRRH